jgi:flagella basal body P-ring formation protein FlgA
MLILFLILNLMTVTTSWGAVAPSKFSEFKDDFQSALKREISKHYGGAVINLLQDVQWDKGQGPQVFTKITVLGDDGKGNLNFSTRHSSGEVESKGWVNIAAWMPVQVAIKRIRPGESLKGEMFSTQTIDVSRGVGYEYRGVLFPSQSTVQGLETAQTVLEGQFLTSSAVQRVPDIRRGDSVRIRLISGDLLLTTSGIAGEPGYYNGKIRVITGKSKRELSGLLQPSGIVEVRL